VIFRSPVERGSSIVDLGVEVPRIEKIIVDWEDGKKLVDQRNHLTGGLPGMFSSGYGRMEIE